MKIGVLGLGSIGQRHARNAVACGLSVFAFDPNADSIQTIAGVKLLQREQLLVSCDAVIVATPNHLHYQDVFDALSANCHVFIEKPIAVSLCGLDSLQLLAQKKNLLLFPAMNLRYHPAVHSAKKHMAEHEPGELLWTRHICSSYLPNWRPNQDYSLGYTVHQGSGGVLLDIIHEFDLAWYLVGAYQLKSCHARHSGLLNIATEDFAIAAMCYQNGALGTVQVDYISQPKRRITEIAFEHYRYELEISGRKLLIYDAANTLLSKETFESNHNNDYQAELKEFIILCEHPKRINDSFAEAVAVLEQVLQARNMAGLMQFEQQTQDLLEA